MENNNLEHFFNKKFNEPIVPDVWNTPSEQVWDLIEADLNKKDRKNRLIALLPWFIAVILFGFLVWFASELRSTKNELTAATTEVKLSKQENTDLIEEVKIKNSQLNSKSSIKPSVTTSSTIDAGNRFIYKSASAPNSQKNKSSIDLNGMDTNMATNYKTTFVTNVETYGTKSSENSIVDTVVVATDLVNIQNLSFSFEPLVSVSDSNLPSPKQNIDPKASNIKTFNNFTLGASTTYNHWNDKYIIMNIQNNNESLLNEKIKNNFSYGLELNNQLGDQWELHLGLRYGKRTHSTSFDLNIPYDMASEVLDAQGVLHSTINHSLPSGYGAVDTEIVLVRSTGSPVSHQENINLNLAFDNQVTYLHLPFAARYYLKDNQKGWFLGAGLQTELIVGQSIIDNQLVSHHSHVHEGSVNTTFATKQSKKANFSAMMHLGYKLKLNNQWNIISSVQYNRGISTVYESTDYKHYVNFFGLSVGINRQF